METELGRGLGKQALLNMRLADLQNVKAGLARGRAYFKYYGREVS